jgi:hypothetical protein
MARANKSLYRRPLFVNVAVFVILFAVLDAGLAAIVVEHEPYSPNIYYHHGLNPNLSMMTQWGRAKYQLFTDNLGLKDQTPRQVPRAGGHRRILFLGDSFVEGLGVPYEKTFVGIVGDRIRQMGGETEVFNGGCLSHSPRLYLLHLQDLVDRLGMHFDEVVVFIDISDVGDELVYKDFAPGKVTALLVMRKLLYFFREHSLLGYDIFRHPRLVRSSVAAMASWTGAQARRDSRPATFPQPPAGSKPSIGFDRIEPDDLDPYRPRDAWVGDDEVFQTWGEHGLRLARENLRRLVEYAEGKGMKVSFAVYPWPRSVHVPGRARDVWRTMAAEENWMLVDLFEDFDTITDAATRFFIRGDIHWNAQGHQFVAERWMAHYCATRQATWCERSVDPKTEEVPHRLQ